jgi:hypothetical protein
VHKKYDETDSKSTLGCENGVADLFGRREEEEYSETLGAVGLKTEDSGSHSFIYNLSTTDNNDSYPSGGERCPALDGLSLGPPCLSWKNCAIRADRAALRALEYDIHTYSKK